MKSFTVVLVVVMATIVLVAAILRQPERSTASGIQIVQGLNTAKSNPFRAEDGPPQPIETAQVNPLKSPPNQVSRALANARGTIVDEPSVDSEARDPSWADPTEAAVRHSLERIPYVNLGTISVVCGSSVCRAFGTLSPNITTFERDKAEKAIIEESYFEPGPGDNYTPKRSTAETGPGNQFTIDLARVHK